MNEPEPAIGATARSARGHEWRHLPNGWWGCYTCDPDGVVRWGWDEIILDSDDDPITVEAA